MDRIAFENMLHVDGPSFGVASANRPEGAGKIHDEISSSTLTPVAASLYRLANLTPCDAILTDMRTKRSEYEL
jgi:hypothetical protein